MGGRGNAGSRNSKSTVRTEEVTGTPLIFGEARITDNYVGIDGYSNKKTLAGALRDLAKAVEKYNKSEADVIRDMIKHKELTQIHAKDGGDYIIEWEEVPSASRYINDEDIEYADGKWYLYVRFVK